MIAYMYIPTWWDFRRRHSKIGRNWLCEACVLKWGEWRRHPLGGDYLTANPYYGFPLRVALAVPSSSERPPPTPPLTANVSGVLL